jgi:hypothetical protein
VDSEEGEAMEDTDRMDEDSNRVLPEEGIIHWCDAKMMYRSSTIPQTTSAVGKI